MKALPLYDDGMRSHFDLERGDDPNHTCTRCKLHRAGALNVCLEPGWIDGQVEKAPLLIVGEWPTRTEDRNGVPLLSASGQAVVRLVQKYWDGPIVVDTAVKCAPGGQKVESREVSKCRSYLRGTYDRVKPERVLCFGTAAIESVCGVRVDAMSVRRGYHWLDDGTLVHLFMPPYQAARNRFLGSYLENDIKKALAAEPEEHEKPPTRDTCFYVVETAKEARDVCDDLRLNHASVCFDAETSGVMWSGDFFEVACLGVAGSEDPDIVYIWDRKALRNPATLKPLADLLEDPTVLKGAQSMKYDINACKADKRLDINVKGIAYDTMIHARQMQSDATSDLEHLQFLVGMGGGKELIEKELSKIQKAITSARSKAGNSLLLPGMVEPQIEAAMQHPDVEWKSFAYGMLPDEMLWRYCAYDIASTGRVGRKFVPVVQSVDYLNHAWNNVYVRTMPAMAHVERWGMPCDQDKVHTLINFLDHELEQVKAQMFKWGDYDPDSTDSKVAFLYKRLGLPVLEKTKTGQPTTKAAVLKRLQDKHPAVEWLLKYQEMATLQNRYGRGMLKWIHEGRVHPSFWLMGARSGRMSSSDPNMQNIPSRNKQMSKMIKGCFTAPPGWHLIQGDFSQLEYRVAAFLTGDPNFIKVFVDGHDMHRRTAELCAPLLHGITLEQAEAMSGEDIAAWRRDAKTVNFGCVSMDTEILTREGWKTYEEVEVGDETLGRSGWVKVLEKVRYEEAPVVDWQGFRVTPNHRWWADCRRGARRERVEEFTTLEEWTSEHRIRLARKQPGGEGLHLTVDECAVLGWLCTDGHVGDYRAQIHQSQTANPSKVEEIDALLQRAGCLKRRSVRKTGIVEWWLEDWKRWAELDAEVGEGLVLRMTAEQRAAFVRAGLEAEGHEQIGAYGSVSTLFTQNEGRVADAFRLAFFLEGAFVREWVHGTYKENTCKRMRLSKPYVTGVKTTKWSRHADAGREPVWCVRTEDETWTMRRGDRMAITGNTLFGMTVRTLAKQLGCPVPRAQQIVNAIYGQFLQLPAWIDKCRDYTARHGIAHAYWDGKVAISRQMYNIASQDGEEASRARNGAVNTPVQGTAALFAPVAIADMVEFILENGIEDSIQIVNTVHDSAIALVRDDLFEWALEWMGVEMTRHSLGEVPLVVDIEHGTSWGNMQPYTLTGKVPEPKL